MTEELDPNTIKNWVLEILSHQNYHIAEVKVTGSSEKGEGYLGDITFAEVFYTKNGETKVLAVVVKSGKPSKSLREKLPLRMVFEREVFMYDTIVPLYQRLETEYRLDYLNKFLPKVYGTILRDGEEVLLLENLKSAGYQLHNRLQTLNINHLNLTLEHYGRFHALGLASKHKNPVEFQEKVLNLPCFVKDFLCAFSVVFDVSEKNIFTVLEEAGELDVANKLKAKFPNGFIEAFIKVLDVKEENCTFIHGDCWNNNYMFKYNRLDRTQPEAVAFLDFQASRAASLVIDLSYHIYSTCSDVELKQFDQLMKTYYHSLSKSLKELNCDPEVVFPFSELQRQWKAYSTLGFIMGTSVLKFCLTDKEETLDIQDIDQKETVERCGQINGKYNQLLRSRLLAAAKHFLNNSFESSDCK